MINLPKGTIVKRYIPKNKFYDSLNLNKKVQREFIDKIDKLIWMHKLSKETIGISPTENVQEIQIFNIVVKNKIIPKSVLEYIDKAIPYPVLYKIIHNDEFAYVIGLKETKVVSDYYISDWNEEINFDFSGINFDIVYQKIIKALIKDVDTMQKNFTDIVELDRERKKLENDIERIKNKIKKERQFNRKVELNKLYWELKNKYDQLIKNNRM